MKKHLKLTLGLFLLSTSVCLFAQEIKLTDPIPTDPNVKIGQLKNGLKYYIRKNEKPEDKVDLRLVINAGSILENDQQQGLAHFMEHMCFNGTKRFPKNELVDYLQSIGVKFGQHLNAYTSFDETVYFLPIPSDDKEKVEKGFQIIEDWAFNTTLTPEEIDKERGVVLEEYRLGLGADKRMMGRFMPKIMYNSLYAKRLPIGQKEILENFTYDKLTSFYKDWYRPDLMAVIVVGDIDVAEMESKIKQHFASYKNPKNEKERKFYDVPNHNETFVAVESDKEASFTRVQLMYKDYEKPIVVKTVGDFKNYLAKGLFSTMLNNRLEEITNGSNPPFTYGYSYHGGTWARTKGAFQSVAMTAEDKQLQALKVLVTENERVKEFGFTQGELQRAKAEFLAQFERQFNERDKNESANYVWEYQGNFLENEPIPSIEWTFNTMKKLLPTISLEDTNNLISKYLKNDNRVVVFTGPDKENVAKPSEGDVLKALEVDKSELKPYEDGSVVESLLRKDVTPGKIVSKSVNEAFNVVTLKLSNGATVEYKKTDFKNDEVQFEAISFGGTNLFSNDDYLNASVALEGISEAGFSGLKLNDINKFMTGKIARVNPYVYGIYEGVRGSSTPKDLEYLLQMTHAYFTDLNFDQEAFSSFVVKQKGFLANIMTMPNMYFNGEFYKFLNQNNPRYRFIPTPEDYDSTDYALAYKLYKERFANAADFNFYFVGNFDEKQLEAYVEKYIASLPSTKSSKEEAKDLGYRMISGTHKKIVNKGKDPKSNVRIQFYGNTEYNTEDATGLKILGEALTIKLIEELRENESGVYGVSASGYMSRLPYGNYSFTISFPCGPENAEKLTESALRELDKVVKNGPTQKDLDKVKEAARLEYKKNLKENKFWMASLKKQYTDDISLDKINEFEKNLDKITVESLKVIAQKYLQGDNVIGILMPEE